ncbi:hypothetical protein HK22_04805 [Gluconobacter sp. DsW_056]|uniref:hypothetical protein n=1 Tax=Gluconobacter sp. DsW_056 TaxID=1511209 RepID=UPI000A364670|nr:hypothetical protein [Gluconobacter sp. DsW_056]OUI80717.1 hypothetical protein HK22_04805 [Gluconobacter sp. DsW_056]
MSLKKSYVALAWTRPVPWAGFNQLSSDIDAASVQSRTVRYQRDLIRQYVREVQGVLEKEVALLELAPDRATPESLKILTDLVHECSPQATFLSVDFTAIQGWRPQPALRRGIPIERCLALAPDPLLMDGKLFDPQAHFRAWRQKEKAHVQSGPEHRQAVLEALVGQEDLSWPKKADLLNAQDLRTHGGKPWTADNLRKFLVLTPK